MADPVRFGLVGPSYTSQSLNADAQLTMNLYPEVDESGAGNAPIVLYPTPGTKLFTTLSGLILDKILTNSGNSNSASITGTPQQAGESAIYIQANGITNGPPAGLVPGTGWNLLDNPNGAGDSSMYAKFLPTGAAVSETQSLVTSDTWATVLALFGSSNGLAPAIVQATTLNSGAFGHGPFSNVFANPVIANNAILLVHCAVITTTPPGGVVVTDSQSDVFANLASVTSGTGATVFLAACGQAKGGVTTVTWQAAAWGGSSTIKAYEISGVGLL